MKLVIVSLVVLYIVSISAQIFTEDVPLFSWSGDSLILGSNINIPKGLKSQDIYQFIQSFFSNNDAGALTKYVKSSSHPEVVVLFLEPKLRSDQVTKYSQTLEYIQNLLKSEKSSLVVPFVDMRTSLDGTLIALTSLAKESGSKIIYAGKGDAPQDITMRVPGIISIPLNGIEAKLEKNSEIFSNGKTDLIIVNLDHIAPNMEEKLQKSVETIQETHEVVKRLTSSYLTIYTAVNYDDPQVPGFGNNIKRAVMQTPTPTPTPTGNNTNNTNNTNWFFTYFGGWFWEVVLLIFIAIPILVSAFYAIDGIQSPDRFGKVKQR